MINFIPIILSLFIADVVPADGRDFDFVAFDVIPALWSIPENEF